MRNGIPGLFHETASLVQDGGGVVTLSSTIMADRPGCWAIGPAVYFIDFGFNLGLVDQPGAGTCAFTSASRSIVDSSGQPVLDSELRNNGGFVPTLALIQSTPAVNRVPESFEDCGFGKLLILGTADLTDARGVPRPQDGTCDIGAFEIGPSFRIGSSHARDHRCGDGSGHRERRRARVRHRRRRHLGAVSWEHGPGTSSLRQPPRPPAPSSWGGGATPSARTARS